MTHRVTILLAGMIALSAVAAPPALADVYTITYTGIASGIDTNGVFGTAGAILSGAAFTSIYTYDPSQFGNAVQFSKPGNQYVIGGTDYSATDPILSASITINGEIYNQSSSAHGQQYLSASPYQPLIQTLAESDDSGLNYLHDNVYGTSPITASLMAQQSMSAYPYQLGAFGFNGEVIKLEDTQVTVAEGPSDVPEPTSFALLAGAAAVFAATIGIRRTIAIM